jgi:hypothetical protein
MLNIQKYMNTLNIQYKKKSEVTVLKSEVAMECSENP